MRAIIGKLTSLPYALQFLLLVNIGSLLFALTMQFGFKVEPCVLCLWQRLPYASAAAVSLLALVWRPYRRQTFILLCLCAAIYLTGMLIAMFHTGVERHWWEGTAGCTVQPLSTGSAEDIRNALLQTVAPRCDSIPWSLFGLSMANFNIAASFALAFFASMAANKVRNDLPD